MNTSEKTKINEEGSIKSADTFYIYIFYLTCLAALKGHCVVFEEKLKLEILTFTTLMR